MRASYIVAILLLIPLLGEGRECRTVFQTRAENVITIPLKSPSFWGARRGQSESLTLDRHSSQGHVANLVAEGELISQFDQTLIERNLVLLRGGLCASTCAASVLAAVASYTEADRIGARELTDLIHQFVKEAEKKFRVDARRGLTLQQLSPLLQRIANDTKIPVETHIKEKDVRLNDLILKPDTFAILAITAGSTRHAIILVGVNKKEQTIQWIDPHDPSEIYSSPFVIEETLDAATVRIKVPWNYLTSRRYSGEIQEVLYIRARPRSSSTSNLRGKLRLAIETWMPQMFKSDLSSSDFTQK